MECGYGDWLKAMGGRAWSPQGRGFGKDNNRDNVYEAWEGTRGSQSTAMVEESSDGEESNQCKTGMEVGEVATGLGGDDLSRHEVRVENHGLEGLDKENRDTCSLVLGVPNSSVDEGTDLVQSLQPEHVERAGLSELKKQPTWTRLVRMDVRPMEIIKEGARSILGKRNMLAMVADGEAEDTMSTGKRGKIGEDLHMLEAAGVLNHPC